ncbi:MAG: hypothetical protein N4A47_03195 [Clostridia bacterium]|jgi:hypothetical protein|nr:hypothetical protein [Clostridia bacterium]
MFDSQFGFEDEINELGNGIISRRDVLREPHKVTVEIPTGDNEFFGNITVRVNMRTSETSINGKKFPNSAVANLIDYYREYNCDDGYEHIFAKEDEEETTEAEVGE